MLRRWLCGEAARSLPLWFGGLGASVPWRVEASVPQWFDLSVSDEEGAYWRRFKPSRFLKPTLSRSWSFVGCSETWGAARDPCIHLFEGRKLEIGGANTR